MASAFNRRSVRGCLGLLGFGIATISLGVLITGIGQMIQGPAGDIPAGLGAAVCMVASGVLGGLLTWYGFTGVFGERTYSDEIESQLLEVAEENDGRVTVAMVAAGTDLSLEESEAILTQLAKEGLARMDVGTQGDEVYVFAGLGESEGALDVDEFEARLAEAREAAREEREVAEVARDE